MGELYIGTSGWTYDDWRGRFYPPGLPQEELLSFYAKHFPTTEINTSFYHVPKPATYEEWAARTPAEFLFAVKVNRYITHTKRLRDAEERWAAFLENAAVLGPKLGPILVQLPPSFRCDTAALGAFLRQTRQVTTARLAFEFRHESWFHPLALELLWKDGSALVIADSERYPRPPAVPTARFVYLRFHGPGALFSSRYSVEELRPWADRIRKWLAEDRTVFAYFNNDFEGNALANAMELRSLARGEALSRSAATAHR